MATGCFCDFVLTTLLSDFLSYNFFFIFIIILLFSAQDKSWLLRDITFYTVKNYLSLVPVLFYEKKEWVDGYGIKSSKHVWCSFLILYIMIIMMSLMNYGSLSNFELCSRRFFCRDFFFSLCLPPLNLTTTLSKQLLKNLSLF